MATPDHIVGILPVGPETGSSTQTPVHGYSFDGDVTNAVNIADLKPIIMMANLATVSEEVQVSSQIPVVNEEDVNLTEGVLRSHLLTKTPTTPSRSKHITTEVYPDSDTGVTYEILRGGTARGRDKLIDSLGFTYNMKQGRGNNKDLTYWWCAVRNTHLRCPASVVQQGNMFLRGKRKHEHYVGQSTPKPHSHSNVKKTPVGRPPGSSKFANMRLTKKQQENPNYRIIKEGSKAGKDLLRDRLGYTYTQKKVSVDGLKVNWRCSVRNANLMCNASVVQTGKTFKAGTAMHGHLPGLNKKASEHDILPKMTDGNDVEDENDFDAYDNSFDSGGAGDSHNYHSYNRNSNSLYTGFGTSPVKKISRQQRIIAKESKRKDHPTFLGPSCTINLTKCDDPDCNCKMVHCPFCDPGHFIPCRAGRVQDHLELTHFAHGVQYDDLMIVKCFQDCNMERNFGHFHCVFCCQQIMKRTSYARHMLRHMRKLGIPDRLLVLPDSKFPDIINAYGFEIPVCKKVSCQPSHDKHYHCPQCNLVCKERSLTVNHLWRCLQRKTEPNENNSDDDEMLNTVNESQLNLHFSHVKNFIDLPLEKCTRPVCCNQMYHCRLCPDSLFRPTYRQHLIAHYVSHWKQRVPYKGYALLKCFHTCEGIDRRFLKTKFHFHCPICCKIILTKGSFEDHIKGCHMFKFGENLIEQNPEEVDHDMEEDVTLVQELAPIHDNVEYMEDKLTALAISLEQQKSRERKARTPVQKKKPLQYGGRFRAPSKKTSDMDKLVMKIKKEISVAMEQEEISQYIDGTDKSFSEDIFGLDITENEIFELGSVIFSDKFIEALKSSTVVNTVLGKVSGLTNTRVTQGDGRFILSGKVEDLIQVKDLLIKAISGIDDSDDSNSDEEEPSPTKKSAKKAKQAYESDEETPTSSKSPRGRKAGKSVGKKGKGPAESVKKGKGRPKKGGDSFPYSEIKEIIEASKKKDGSVKRGPGRPPKTLAAPVNKSVMKKKSEKAQEVAKSPSRYGTRGIKRNYLEMNSGNKRMEVKQEIVSDDEDEASYEEEEEDDPGTSNTKGRTAGDNQDEVTYNEEEDDDVKGKNKASYLDDSEQEELDLMSSENEKEDADVSLADKSTDSSDKVTESIVQGLKTSNVSTSVPLISKVGIKQYNSGKRKPKKDSECDDQEIEKMMNSVDVDKLKCSLCDDFTAQSFADMTQHLMTFHHVYEPPRCDVCELDLDTDASLNTHIIRKHGPKPEPGFRCSVGDCNKVFSFETSLRSHVNSIHKIPGVMVKSKKHNCETCGYKSNSIQDLYRHKKVEHSQDPVCEFCQKAFSSYQSLKAHLDLKHSDSVPRVCTICCKEFSNQTYLQRHMKFHNMAYTCKECGKPVSTMASLVAHLETHKPEEERNYKFSCSYCSKKFFLKNNYEDHLNKHTGNRPYKCDLCEKRFGFRSMLKKHKTFVHSSERPFKCGFCMKGFKFMNLLKNHVSIHTQDSKHVCHCAKNFSTAQTLKFHQQKCKTYIDFVSLPQDGAVFMTVPTDQATDIMNTVVPTEQMAMMETELLPPENHVAATTGNVADNITAPSEIEVPVENAETSVPASTTVEVYACSECRATFRDFKDAEMHVLTAHSQITV